MRKVLIFTGLMFLVAWSFALGWRGLLQKGLAFLGFRRSSALMGFVWCLWHVFWILQGHSEPQYRMVGVFVTTLWGMSRDR